MLVIIHWNESDIGRLCVNTCINEPLAGNEKIILVVILLNQKQTF